jgi:hypothetical protein
MTSTENHGSNGGSNGAHRRRWRDRPITNLRGTIGAIIVVGGFVATLWRIDQGNDSATRQVIAEANVRDAADCRSLNDRTRFGQMSREDQIERLGERIEELQTRVDTPFNPADFPGYDRLDDATQAFVNGLTARNREAAFIELAETEGEMTAAKEDLALYREAIPLLDCNDSGDIDDGDFTGR